METLEAHKTAVEIVQEFLGLDDDQVIPDHFCVLVDLIQQALEAK